MAAVLYLYIPLLYNLRTHPAALSGKVREGRVHIETRYDPAHVLYRDVERGGTGEEEVEYLLLTPCRILRRARDPCLKLLKLRRDEALPADKGLASDKVWGNLIKLTLRHLYIRAEDPVLPGLHALYACLGLDTLKILIQKCRATLLKLPVPVQLLIETRKDDRACGCGVGAVAAYRAHDILRERQERIE